jgi:hypothetical protein
LSHPGLLVFADWYHLESIEKLRFYDDNTRSWWEAATGGLGGLWVGKCSLCADARQPGRQHSIIRDAWLLLFRRLQ